MERSNEAQTGILLHFVNTQRFTQPHIQALALAAGHCLSIQIDAKGMDSLSS
jgi:hypothetical protein